MKTEDSQRELLAYEVQALEASEVQAREAPRVEAGGAPPPRRRRSWRVVGAIFGAVLLVLVGVAVGAVARNRSVDDQRRRAADAEQQVSSLRQRVDQEQNAIDDQQRQITRYREQLQRLQQSLARARAAQAPQGPGATSFTDGLYQVRVAIQPGQYHTGGSDSCYWAKLSTGDTNRVIDNNVGAGPQTVTIDSPYFESEGCGTWTKVG